MQSTTTRYLISYIWNNATFKCIICYAWKNIVTKSFQRHVPNLHSILWKSYWYMAINATKALELRNKNNHNYLSMSAEEVSNSVIFRGSFADMNFNILSLLSSEGSEIKRNLRLWSSLYHRLFNKKYDFLINVN